MLFHALLTVHAMPDDDVLAAIAAAIQSGSLGQAEQLCRSHLEGFPDDANVMLLLGLALQRQGRAIEAVGMYRRLTELYPGSTMHWGNYVTALRVAGDPQAALEAARTMVELAPDQAEPLEQQGLLEMRCGRLAEARDSLLGAWAKAPDSASVRIHAARACIACRDARAEMLVQPWQEWLPLEDGLQMDLAEVLIQVSDVRGAVQVLEDLLRRGSSEAPARLLLAKCYERINLVDDADALLQAVAAGDAATQDGIQQEIARQQVQIAMRRRSYPKAHALLLQLGESDANDYGHYFSLARVSDKLGDSAATMAALATAHARQVEEARGYVAHLLEPGAPPLPHSDDRLEPADYRAWPQLRAPEAAQSPVFVVGFPRSGTTLLEQMLDAHPRMQSMDERPFFNRLAGQLEDIDIEVPQDLGRLDQRDCDELRKGYLIMACGKVPRRWDAQLVDKNPLNMLWLPMIRRMFPAARFILALRHPCDVILSCYLQNFRAAPLVVASRSLEALARAYVAAMENWLYHVDLIQPELLVSRYETLVADAPGQVRRIAEFLGIGDSEALLGFDARAREKGFIATPSYTQVIEPINARSIGHWQRYRAYFEPVLPILQPMLAHWNYDVDADQGAVDTPRSSAS